MLSDSARSVAGVALGQREAWDREYASFVQHAAADLGRAAWFLTGDHHRAAELVQSALVKTYVAWPRARDQPVAYARRVMVNARTDSWRRRRREVLVAPECLPAVAGALDAAGVVEDRDQLVRALRRLSGGQRRAVVMRYLVGMTVAEAAETLGVTEGTVKTQSARGLTKLRAEMERGPGSDSKREGTR